MLMLFVLIVLWVVALVATIYLLSTGIKDAALLHEAWIIMATIRHEDLSSAVRTTAIDRFLDKAYQPESFRQRLRRIFSGIREPRDIMAEYFGGSIDPSLE